MSTYADTVDIKALMNQRRIAKDTYGNGIEYPFARDLLQRARATRLPGVCPYCGSVLSHNSHRHLIDLGRRGIRCTECVDER